MNKQQALFEYCLRLGDTSLILGQRLSEWCGHGPILEEDIGLTNISLDYIGHATSILKYAALVENKGRTEDDLAYQRNERDFKNALLVEQPNGDYACTIARQFLFSVFAFYLYEELKKSKDETLAGIAAKALKEITYHLRHSTEWMYRMGDGTEESHIRMQNALNDLWMFTGDLFEMHEADALMIKEGVGVDLKMIRSKWEKHIDEVVKKATLKIPSETFMQKGSLEGKHTEHLGYILAEMQYLPRTYPDATW